MGHPHWDKPRINPANTSIVLPRGPRAVPGTYQVRLTVDDKVLTQPLKIVMDPRSPATPRDLEQQLQLGRQIFAEAVRGRQGLAQIRAVQKQLNELEPKLDGHADLKSTVLRLESEIRKILAGTEDSVQPDGLEDASTGLASALAVVESGDRPCLRRPSLSIANRLRR